MWSEVTTNFDILSAIAGFVVGALFVALIGRARR
jgi:multisubunit Na+/H+ antiporter MnhE subunit